MIDNKNFEYFKVVSGKESLSDIFDMELNTFESVSVKPKVTGYISLYDLLIKIKYNFLDDISITDFLTTKYIADTLNPVYEKIKANKRTVCYNATFDGYKALTNLISATNLMFLDIDGFESKAETLTYKEMIVRKYDWIVSCNLSLSRLGLHVIILVDKIVDNDDFNRKYDLINTIYFDGKLDANAKSLTRHTIIPSDVNIYINDNPNTLNIDSITKNINTLGLIKYDNPVDITINHDKESTRSVYKEKEVICSPHTFSGKKELKDITNIAARVYGLCFEDCFDESEFTDPNTPLFFPEGVDVIKLNLHPYKYHKIEVGNRNNTIGGISMRLIYLSTNRCLNEPDENTKTAVQKYIQSLNLKICNPPLPYNEVLNSVNSNWNRYVAGELDLSGLFVKKHTFWSKRCSLKPNEKRSYSSKKINEPIAMDSKNKIADAIEKLKSTNQKITQKKVADLSTLHLQTVKKYWKDYKSLAKLNH